MSLIAPPGSGHTSGPNSRGRRRGGKGGGGRRHEENNRIYAHPLPLVFAEPTPSRLGSVLGLLGLHRTNTLNPHCEGVFDPATRSVWVLDSAHAMILWRRGFFGKGDLSRSEPSWLARQISDRMATARGNLTAEQIRERRRAERAQFKLDRAKAIATVTAEAEKVFEEEGRVVTVEENRALIPSAATWKASPSTTTAPASASVPVPGPSSVPDTVIQSQEDPAAMEADDALTKEEEEPLEDLEHLQLTLPEAFFLIWTMDCLTVLHPDTHQPMTLPQLWLAFQEVHHPLPLAELSLSSAGGPRFDNPFLVNYVAYHHYRALGWVVKGGIKFCVDLLLYKRGPVFSHAEFAIVVIPVYEDLQDKENSPYDFPNQEPFPWSWLSTINRVNSQVHKTLILTYVTIPSSQRGSPSPLDSPACLAHYSVREVVVRRFIPARMRE